MTEPKRPSLFAQQMAILDERKDHATRSHPSTTAEKQRIDAMHLPALDLPLMMRPRRPLAPVVGAFIALAAALTLVLWVRGAARDDDIRVKGDAQIWIYWERYGEVRSFEAGTTLANGDRVRAEVLAPEALVAYWVVTTQDGRVLSPASDVWDSALRLGPGQRGAFAGSFKLVGEPEGETLVVITCRGRDLSRALVEDLTRPGGVPFKETTLPSACDVDSFRLR